MSTPCRVGSPATKRFSSVPSAGHFQRMSLTGAAGAGIGCAGGVGDTGLVATGRGGVVAVGVAGRASVPATVAGRAGAVEGRDTTVAVLAPRGYRRSFCPG